MPKTSRFLYQLAFWIAWALLHIIHPVWHIKGRSNLPECPYLLVANHCAATDPIYLIIAVRPKKMHRIMAKKELLDKPVVGPFLQKIGAFAVDREGNAALSLMHAMKTLRAKQSLLLFPEGTRRKPGQTIKPKGGAAVLAARCDVPVVPAFISLDKRLFRPISVIFGQPYRIRSESRRLSAEEEERFAEEMMQKCYTLGDVQ